MITIEHIKKWFKKVYDTFGLSIIIVPILLLFFTCTVSYFYHIDDKNEKQEPTKEMVFWNTNRNIDCVIVEKSLKNKKILLKNYFIKNNEGLNDKNFYIKLDYLDGIKYNIGDTIKLNTSYSKIYEISNLYMMSDDNPVTVLMPEENDDADSFGKALGILFILAVGIITIYGGCSVINENINHNFVNGITGIILKLVIFGIGILMAFFIKSCE